MVKTIADEACWFDGEEETAPSPGEPQQVPFPEGYRRPDPANQELGDAIERELCRRHEGNLGRAALNVLRGYVGPEIAWAIAKHDERIGPFEPFVRARALIGAAKFFQQFKADDLRIERTDQDERDRAARDGEEGIARFLLRHESRMRRQQRLHPGRWNVPEYSDEDVRGEIVVETLACFRRVGGFESHQRPGRAATFQLASSVVKRMQRKRLISIAVTPDLASLPARTPTPEGLVLQAERERRLSAMPWKTGNALSRIQERWLDAFRRDIDLHGKLRLVRVARHAGRSKAAATEARNSIRDAFEVLGYDDLLDD